MPIKIHILKNRDKTFDELPIPESHRMILENLAEPLIQELGCVKIILSKVEFDR